MNRLKFLNRWLLLLALASLLTSCLPHQVDLAATPSPQKTLTPVSTSTSTLIPSRTPTAAFPPTATYTPTTLPTAPLAPTPPPITAMPDVQPPVLQSQRGGGFNGVALSGNTAYVGIGPRLAAVDVTDPAAPRLLAQSPTLPGEVSGVLLFPAQPQAPAAAAVSAGRTIEVFNISQPENLSDNQFVMGIVVLPGAVNTMVLDTKNRVLYAGGSIYQSYDPISGPINSGFVAVVDLNSRPTLGPVTLLSGPVSSLALTDSTLFACLGGTVNGVVGMALDTPTKPGQPVTVIPPAGSTGDFVYAMQAAGSRLYLASYDYLTAYDVTNPAVSNYLWESSLGMLVFGVLLHPDRIDVIGLAPVGNYEVQQIRIAPTEPVQADRTGVTASNVASAGNQLYLTRDGLEIFDVSDLPLQKLKPRGAYQPPLLVTIAHVARGDMVYTLDTDSFQHNWSQWLHVLRMSNLEIVSEYRFKGPDDAPGWEYFYSMEIEGNRLYLFDYHQGTWVFDLSDPLKPALLDRPGPFYEGLTAATVGVMGSRRLVFQANPVDTSTTLVAYDVTDIGAIAVLSSLELKNETPQRLVWSGKLLYAVTQGIAPSGVDWTYSLEIFSLDKDTLQLQSRTPLAADSRLAVRGNLIALAGPQGLVIVSADPARPQVRSQTTLAGSGAILAFQDDNRLLVALKGSPDQFLTFDLADPGHPSLLSDNDIPPAEQITLADPYMVLSSNSAGIEVMK